MHEQLFWRYRVPFARLHDRGRRRQDALCHAEITTLMRLTRALSGSLRGQTIELTAERALSSSCKTVLPIVAFELGNPMINLKDAFGDTYAVHDGNPLELAPQAKRSHRFGARRGSFWPEPDVLSPLFLAPFGQEWTYEGHNDSWELDIRGVNSTGDLPAFGHMGKTGRDTQVEAHLSLEGHLIGGVQIEYTKFGGGLDECYYSAGRPTPLNDYIRTLHSDLRPLKLYIPFRDAWPAVKEFMETEGELPKCIPWIPSNDLPDNTFPAPHDPNVIAIND